MTKWLIKCSKCGAERVLEVSFNLYTVGDGRIYLYCPRCGSNQFHLVVAKLGEHEAQQGE